MPLTTPGAASVSGEGLQDLSERPLAGRSVRLHLEATDAATATALAALVGRGAVPDARIRDDARVILEDVRVGGAAALRRANTTYGGGRTDGDLFVDRAELAAAADRLTKEVRRALDQAIANVRRFAEPQRPETTRTTIVPGVEIERRWTPLRRVGCYVPGGSAPYPSSLVMTVVPARGAVVIETIEAGEVVGWSWLFPPYQWHFDARAVSLVRATSFDGVCLREKCEQDPAFGYDLMSRFTQVLIERLQWTRLRLLDVYGDGRSR